MSEDYYDMSENYNMLLPLIKTGNLEESKILYENGTLIRKMVEQDNFFLFRYSCLKGKLEICQWLCETYYITKEEAMLEGNVAFVLACYNNRYNIISFLCNTLGITEDYVKNIIINFSKKEQEKILDCLAPFGSFAKPAK